MRSRADGRVGSMCRGGRGGASQSGRVLLLLLVLLLLALAAGVAAWVYLSPMGPAVVVPPTPGNGTGAGTDGGGSPDGGNGTVEPGAGALPEGGPHLREITEKAGVTVETTCGRPDKKRFIIEANGSGAGVLDYDLDGDLDIYVVNGSTVDILKQTAEPVRNYLFRNDGDLKFTEVAVEAGVADTGWGYGCAVADIDNDGDPDLFVSNYGKNVLYRNKGDGTFEDISAAAGIDDAGWGESAAFGDIDNDGDLDLYLCRKIDFDIDNPPNDGKPCLVHGLMAMCGPLGLPALHDRLYRNTGDGTFEDISEEAGILVGDPLYGLGVVMADLDDDGWLDIYVANDSVPNQYWHNLGGGKFEELATIAGLATRDDGHSQAGMGVDTGDVNGDGLLDIIVTNFSMDHYTYYLNSGGNLFRDATYLAGLGEGTWVMLGWGTKLFDVDNDGDLDAYFANGHVYLEVEDQDRGESYVQPDQLYHNNGEGRFVESSERIRIEGEPRASRGSVFGDLDDDGDIDVLVVEMDARPTLLENVGGSEAGRWLQVSLRGRQANREGIGAKVFVKVGDRTIRRDVTRSGSYCSSHDVRAHFGLGEAEGVDSIRVVWPGGKEQEIGPVPAGREILIDEEKGLVEPE